MDFPIDHNRNFRFSKTCVSYFTGVLNSVVILMLLYLDRLVILKPTKSPEAYEVDLNLELQTELSQKQIEETLEIYKNRPYKNPFKHFYCQTNCSASKFLAVLDKFPVIPFDNRRKLKNITSNQFLFHKWGRGYAELNLFHEDLPPIYEAYLLELADSYVEQFWSDQMKVNEVYIEDNTPNINIGFIPKTKIPEIYHYTWFSCREFKLIHLISMLSVLKFSSPDSKIYLHTDCLPDILENKDDKTNLFLKILKIAGHRLHIQKISPYKTIWEHVYFNKTTGILSEDIDLPADPVPLGKIVHVSDVYRLFLLIKYGGIYLDDDLVLLKSHQQFLNSETLVIAQESEASLANGFMMAPANCLILKRWLLEYKFYQNVMTGPYSVMKIFALSVRFPHEVTVIKNRMVRPNWKERGLLFGAYLDWSQSFNMHLRVLFGVLRFI